MRLTRCAAMATWGRKPKCIILQLFDYCSPLPGLRRYYGLPV